MKGYIKIPIETEYDRLNVKITFNLHIIDLEKYIKDGFIYLQIIDDNTRSIIKEKSEIKIDKMTAKITLNIPIETFYLYIRGRNGGFIYAKDITKMKKKDLE